MSTKAFIWLVVVLLACHALRVAGAGLGNETNLIRNGDFSAGLENWTVSDGSGVNAVILDPDTKCGDMKSVKLRQEKPEVKTAGFLESQRFPTKAGQVYLLECNVKGKDIPSSLPTVLTTCFYTSNQVKGSYNVGAYLSSGPGPGGSLPFGTFDWQSYRFYARAFDGTDMAAIRFSAPTGGVFWVSDIRMTEVPVLRDVKYEIRDAISLGDVYGSASEGYLTDGFFYWNQAVTDQRAANEKLKRGYRGLEQGIAVTLALPRMATVDRLVLSLGRVNRGHSLRKIEVFCNKYGQLIKMAEGPAYLTEEFNQGLWIIEAPVRQRTDTIELKLFGGGYLVPLEIMVVEDKGADNKKGADMNKFMMAGWVVLAAAATAAQEPVVVENEYVRMEFAPAEGGVCKRMLYKPANKELVYAYGDAGYGLFRDRFWAPTWRDFADVAYQHEVTKTPDSESIHLWGRGAGGIYSFTEVHKTITLTKGSPLIRAEYEIKNTVDSFTDADYGFWVHNFLGVVGGKNEYFIPTREGILEVWNDPNKKPKNPDLWVKNPTRGWMAGIGDGGHGLAWGVDYKYLNLFYQYLGLAIPTCEWQYNRITVPSGQSLKTEITLMPFTGLERVDGYFSGVAGSIVLSAPGSAPKVALVGAGDRKLTLKFRSKLLPATGWTEGGTKEVVLKNAVVQNVAWPQELAIAAGTTVIGCEVMENGQVIGVLERPLVMGTASGKYALSPECAQVGSKEEVAVVAKASKVPEHKLVLEVVSPHVPWGKPYARGPIKALILTDCSHQREIVELMQRFDLAVETEKIFFDTTNSSFPYIGEQSMRTPQQAQARLKKKLQEPLDVIMIAGLHWTKTFDAETRKAILEKVKAGTGLVIVAPIGVGDDLKEILPFATGEKKNGYNFIELKQKHYLTAGIPYDLLPQTGGIMYEGQIPEEKTLLVQKTGAAKKEVPLLGIGNMGKGRIVYFLWDVYSHNLIGEGYAFSRITPLMLNEQDRKTEKPGVMTNRGGRKITWRCWEYIFSSLGKSLAWAANREPDLAAEVTGRDEKGEVGVTVECPDAKRNVVLELTYRNKFSEDEKTDRQKVELVKGSNTFHFTPPTGLMPGMTLTDLRALTPEGKVITWASGYYETKPLVEITGVEFEKPILPAGSEPVIRGQVKLSVEAGADHVLEIMVTDFHDRLVCRQTVKPVGTNTTFEARLLDILSMPMTVDVQLKKGAEILDKRTETVLFLKERTWDPKQCCQYEWYHTPIQGPSILYLYDVGRRLTRPIGITSMMDYPFRAALDVEANTFPSPLAFLDISDPKFREKSNAYAKTKDRKELFREPCLWDPVYREKAKKAMYNAASNAMTCGGGYSYCLGDEMTLTSYNTYYDYDFSPASVAQYREWLKKRYGKVENLNREWETTYKDWAEIEPVTAEEARKRENENYAPWADFRTFMDDTLSDFFDYLQKYLAEVDPKAKISLSGTQDATAGNGMDWWKLCHSLKALHSYRSNTEYIHQSFSRTTGTLVAPYLNNACGRNSGPSQEGSMWWSVFYECFGLTSLGTPNYFLPDLTLSETGEGAKNFLAEVRGGIWPLLRSVRRDPAPIAILYSHPSIQANCIIKREQRCQQVRDSWVKLLHDMGLQFDFVAYAQLEEKGFLAKQGYKALILPEALALSGKEVAEIKAYAKAGGVVIADNSVGWMNEHCRTLKKGQLDDLFGLSADRQPAAGGKPKLTRRGGKENWGGLTNGGTIAGFAPVGKVMPVKATAVLVSDDPANSAIYLNPYGKGQAVYLNLSLVPFREERQMGGRGEMVFHQLIGGTLVLAGIRPEFVVEAAGKKNFHGHVVSFTDKSEKPATIRSAGSPPASSGQVKPWSPAAPPKAGKRGSPLSWKTLFRQWLATLHEWRDSFRSVRMSSATDPDKNVRYLGIIREYASGEPEEAFTIRLPGKFCVYDVRAKKYLGKTDSINAILYAGAAKLYALMPQEMREPVLTCPETVQRGAKLTGGVELTEPKKAYRVVRVEVYDPSGMLWSCYSGPQILPPGTGKAEFGFTPALNDPLGKWTIKAVELVSGKTAESKLTVKE